jgi:hypothetical protein
MSTNKLAFTHAPGGQRHELTGSMHTCTCTTRHVCTHKHRNPIHLWRGTYTHGWASNPPCHHVFHSIHSHQKHPKIPATAHAEILQFLHKRIAQFCTHFHSLCRIVVSLHPVLPCCVVLHYHHAFVVLWLAGSPCISTCCIHALHHRICVLWLCLCLLYRPSQPSYAAWYFAVISDIINNTSVIIVYCFGLLAAIGAEVVASSAPRATLVGGNAETIATLWVRGGAALVALVIITLISVKVSSTSVNTVNIVSNSDQPDQKTRHDERSETQAPEGSNPSSGSHGLPSPSIVATELGDDFKSCHACSCNDSCNSSLRSAVSCPLSIIESSDGSDCDDRVVNDNTFFFGKPEQGEPHAPVFGTQHSCSHARVSQWLDDNLPAQSTGLEGCDSPQADAHSDCTCMHSPPSLVHPNGTPTLESEYHRPCAGSRSENSTANAVDDTGSTSDCCKCTGSSSGDGGVPGPVERPARRPDQLTIGPAVTVRAASYRYVLWHIVASALLAAILCAVIRLATSPNSTQHAAALLYNYQTTVCQTPGCKLVHSL